MSTKGIRDFRPRIHFAPTDNWMNDPNGMVYINGTYHFATRNTPVIPYGGQCTGGMR